MHCFIFHCPLPYSTFVFLSIFVELHCFISLPFPLFDLCLCLYWYWLSCIVLYQCPLPFYNCIYIDICWVALFKPFPSISFVFLVIFVEWQCLSYCPPPYFSFDSFYICYIFSPISFVFLFIFVELHCFISLASLLCTALHQRVAAIKIQPSTPFLDLFWQT